MISLFEKDLPIRKRWEMTGLIWAMMMVLVIVAFWQTVSQLVATWWNEPYYNHCLLIIPIVVYILYERREIFDRLAPKPSFWGLPLIAAGAAGWLLGDLADANVVCQLGLVVLIQGTILTMIGVRAVHGLLFPFLYLYFLVPFGNFLIPVLQDVTTFFVVKTLHLLDIPVYVEGVFLTLPNGKFHVAEACAGLRFLVATVALGLLMANIAYKTLGRQVIVVLLSFVIPVLANGVRATGIVLIGYYSQMQYAVGVDHLVYGWFFFALVLLVFISIAMTFTNRKLSDGYIDFDRDYWARDPGGFDKSRWGVLLAIGIFLVIAGPLYSLNVQNRIDLAEEAGRDYTPPPLAAFEVVKEESRWHPRFDGADQEFLTTLEDADEELKFDFYVARYAYQDSGKEMIRFGNTVAAPQMWSRTAGRTLSGEFGGQKYDLIEETIHSGLGNRLVWYIYYVDGKFVNSPYLAKLYDAKAKLLGGKLEAMVIAISVPLRDDNVKDGRRRLMEIAHRMPALSIIVSP